MEALEVLAEVHLGQPYRLRQLLRHPLIASVAQINESKNAELLFDNAHFHELYVLVVMAFDVVPRKLMHVEDGHVLLVRCSHLVVPDAVVAKLVAVVARIGTNGRPSKLVVDEALVTDPL